MKISVSKESFIKSWSLAERSAGTSGSMNIFSTVRVYADDNGVELQATDIRTSIICAAQGVTVLEPGEAIIPIKGVSDLFKKASSAEFSIQVEDGKATMISGKSRYKFSTYPLGEFPKLPSSSGGKNFCSISASNLISTLERGTICASSGDEYPQYLSSALFEMKDGFINIVSTDKRRLAISRSEVLRESESDSILLPMKGLRELQRILGMIDSNAVIEILFDDSQAYFVTSGMEFAVRRVESKFPPYAKLIPTTHTTAAYIDRSTLISAIERVDVVVRDYNRTVIMNLTADGSCKLIGRAQEFGEAVENIQCEVDGEPLLMGFNTRFFHDALKVFDDASACLLFTSRDSHMLVRAKDSDSFLCMVAPLELSKEEVDLERNLDEEVDVL
ncbi:MAG: DNA polymerase III subunit beta [Synergistaceae bacterium]|jgi:DNA polymerase-3 subunit beta|nr:DNA polymerase III subunit beta [Synergistaceae bacterium]